MVLKNAASRAAGSRGAARRTVILGGLAGRITEAISGGISKTLQRHSELIFSRLPHRRC